MKKKTRKEKKPVEPRKMTLLEQERMDCARHTLAGAIAQIKKAKGE